MDESWEREGSADGGCEEVDWEAEAQLEEFERARMSFPRLSVADAAKAADESDAWLVPGLVSASTTLLYGEAKVGKSWIAAHLVAALITGGEFLGVGVSARRAFSVAVCHTDDAGHAEYATRIRDLVDGPASERVGLYRLGTMSERRWGDLYQVIVYEGHNVVVIDNLTQLLDGSMNDDAVVRRCFEGIRLFTRAGIAVVIVGHSSDKANLHGRKPTTPMGSAYISQAVRWLMHVRKARGGRLAVRVFGNLGHGDEFELQPGQGARYTVLPGPEAGARERRRSPETLNRNAEMADWVVANCRGLSQNQTAKSMAKQFGGSESSYRKWLGPKGKLATLVRRDGDGWQRTQAGYTEISSAE